MVIMYWPTCWNTSRPIWPTARANRAKTPMGSRRITAAVNFIMASKAALKKRRSVSPDSPLITPMAPPRQIEKKIRPRMSKEAAASIGFAGINRVMMSAQDHGDQDLPVKSQFHEKVSLFACGASGCYVTSIVRSELTLRSRHREESPVRRAAAGRRSICSFGGDRRFGKPTSRYPAAPAEYPGVQWCSD